MDAIPVLNWYDHGKGESTIGRQEDVGRVIDVYIDRAGSVVWYNLSIVRLSVVSARR